MKKNVGNVDKLVRVLLAVVFVVLFFTNVVSGTLGFILLGLAGVLVVTVLLGFCPIYFPLGLSTRPKQKE
jgi:hypothetical protein